MRQATSFVSSNFSYISMLATIVAEGDQPLRIYVYSTMGPIVHVAGGGLMGPHGDMVPNGAPLGLIQYSTIPAYSFKQSNVELDVSVPAGAAGSLVVGDDVLDPTPVEE